MSENLLKPRIRFKGFTDAWKQRKFDEVVNRIGTGLNPRDNFVLNNGGKNYYVTIKNFEHGHLYLDDNCDKVDDEALKIIQERSDLKTNDILFTSIGRIGDCYLIRNQPKNWNINESVFTLRPNQNEVDPEYLFHVIHSEKVLNQILNDVTGSTFKSIKIGDLKKTEISKPNKVEQLKIAKFVTKLDDIITLHQRKYEKLLQIKKSLLEKMFPTDGMDKPKIRFKGYTDAWKQRKIEDILKFERPDKYMINDDHYQETGIPVLTANKAFILGYREESGAYDKGSCIIYDDFTLDLKYVDFPFKVNSSVIKILTPKNDSDIMFDYYLLSSTPILQQGHARHYISVVQPTEVRVPNGEESEKIKTLLSGIENLITLHQRKCEKLKNIKKSLLEKMFV
ncbi:MAG: restriction endonuclease subunit S [Lachnospiraceae bacterium]|nr:restriction endonuclease subunit S [Lachnospiraceae bacterium]